MRHPKHIAQLRILLDLDLHSLSPHFFCTQAVLGWGLAPVLRCLFLNLFLLGFSVDLTFLSVGIKGVGA